MTSHNCQRSQDGLTQITYSRIRYSLSYIKKLSHLLLKQWQNAIQNINSLVHSKMEHSVNYMMFRLCHSFFPFPFLKSVKPEDKSQKMKLLHMCLAFNTMSMISHNCQTFKPFWHNVLEGLLLPRCKPSNNFGTCFSNIGNIPLQKISGLVHSTPNGAHCEQPNLRLCHS